ncbi:MAG: ABC transporter substrate-binding protein [Burkholderiaceae bacterium]|jgi:putative spermidine/putrescine transport system substrate-binding protein|nr:ABC transporter substrate-binding protein [Burkholderiaceae bacterium]
MQNIRGKFLRLYATHLGMAAALLCAGSGALAQNREVIQQDPGGAYGDALRKLLYEPFAKETGIRVKTVMEGRSGPRIKKQVESGHTEWDMAYIYEQETRQLADCCLAKIDYRKLTPEAQKTIASMPKEAVTPTGIALEVIGVAMAYSTKKFPNPGQQPKNWADFWNVKDYPGKRCLPTFPRFLFEAALMADGVPRDKLYPIDVERALKKIAEIKPHVTKWWLTTAQPPQLLLDGEATMCMAYAARINDLILNEPDSHLAMTWNQGFTYYNYLSIPKNSPNPEATLKLLSYRLVPQNAARFANFYGVPLPSPLVYEVGDPKIRASWSTNPDNEKVAVKWNADWWGAPSPDGRTNEEWAQERLNTVLAK